MVAVENLPSLCGCGCTQIVSHLGRWLLFVGCLTSQQHASVSPGQSEDGTSATSFLQSSFPASDRCCDALTCPRIESSKHLCPAKLKTRYNHNNRIQRRNSSFLQSPHCSANRLQHDRSSGSGAVVCKSRATHRALITCNMPCYVRRGTKEQRSY